MPSTLCRVLAVRALEPDGAVLTVAWTADVAPRPFQFFMLSVPGDAAFPFLPRPFSVYDARKGELDFLVKVVGRGTASLARVGPGDHVRVSGPLGNGVDPAALAADPKRRVIGVAGGVGIAPFLLLLRDWRGAPPAARPLLIYGARTRDLLWDLDRFEALPIEVRSCTDDGSHGRKGRADALLADALAEGPADVLCCGPDPMMEAVATSCRERGVRCLVSLENFMACGYGVCNACAVKVRDDRYRQGFRFDRSCVEGPVFDAASIESLH